MNSTLVHTHKGIQPPTIGVFIDLSFASHEAGVQPRECRILRRELQPSKDRPHRPGALLLDALAMHRQQDLATGLGSDKTTQVRRPDAIVAAPRVVRPHQSPAHHIAGHRARAAAKSGRLPTTATTTTRISVAPVGPMPAGLFIEHLDTAQRFESHEPMRTTPPDPRQRTPP